MFEDSLMESGGKLKTKQGATTAVSFILQILLIGVLVLLPLIFTEALPKQQLMTFLVAPPPPPPPPPPAAMPEVKIVKPRTSDLDNGQLRTPTAIPKKVAMIKEDEPPPPSTGVAGVVGGVPGGVPGGAMGGVVNAVVAPALANRPAKNLRPSGDSASLSFCDIKAFALDFVSNSDWCRCHPLASVLGRPGRHMKLTR